MKNQLAIAQMHHTVPIKLTIRVILSQKEKKKRKRKLLLPCFPTFTAHHTFYPTPRSTVQNSHSLLAGIIIVFSFAVQYPFFFFFWFLSLFLFGSKNFKYVYVVRYSETRGFRKLVKSPRTPHQTTILTLVSRNCSR
jgi:hypothetical protein